MKKVTFAVEDGVYLDLLAVLEHCNLTNKARAGFTTHGDLTLSALFSMLADDVAMTKTRPGSWEGSNMEAVLVGHGYAQ